MIKVPEVSVLMPVYNAESFLKISIESILGQTFREFELIILNDASTDRSEDAILAIKDDRIIYARNDENGGIAFTRNRLISMAKGRYLAMLDADDVAYPERLEYQLKFLKQNPEFGIISTGCHIIDYQGNVMAKISRAIKPEFVSSILFFKNCIVQSSVMINRKFLPDPAYDLSYPPTEDYELWNRMSSRCKIMISPECLVQYRVHATNTTVKRKDLLNSSLGKVIKSQIEKLDIEPTDMEFNIHFSFSIPDSELPLQDVLNWLIKLKARNDQKAFYPSLIFNKVILDIWINYFNQYKLYSIKAITSFFDRRLGGRLKHWFNISVIKLVYKTLISGK